MSLRIGKNRIEKEIWKMKKIDRRICEECVRKKYYDDKHKVRVIGFTLYEFISGVVYVTVFVVNRSKHFQKTVPCNIDDCPYRLEHLVSENQIEVRHVGL